MPYASPLLYLYSLEPSSPMLLSAEVSPSVSPSFEVVVALFVTVIEPPVTEADALVPWTPTPT